LHSAFTLIQNLHMHTQPNPEPTNYLNTWDRRVELGSSMTNTKGWYSRGYVPHFDETGSIQHITFHLADSLPKDALDRMEYELKFSPRMEVENKRRIRLQLMLDIGMGACLLAKGTYAKIVEDSLLYGDGDRYRLICWVVMPNHVHVMIEQFPHWPLAKIVQSWKRHTSRKIHLLEAEKNRENAEHNSAIPVSGKGKDAEYNSAIPGGGQNPPLWQRDYWDRFIRNNAHFEKARWYIENNPVSAGLCNSPAEWKWGSASFNCD